MSAETGSAHFNIPPPVRIGRFFVSVDAMLVTDQETVIWNADFDS